MGKLPKLFILVSFFMGTVILGCATKPYRMPSSSELGEESRAHPAATLVDLFQVNRPIPQHKPSNNEEFYFKRCSMTGDNWPISKTSYDCTYP
ncbi:MAG: hypothetical protein A2Z20_07830 [Bdellovibrionales bacterium RBG_16_40_8]|nr:MAG: hypothetical protein A2Z20_07830 [Bdellovibrionales bacterium RBG_16_40_8]